MEAQKIPVEVVKRQRGWFFTFWGFTLMHYFFGVGGVLASTIAAASTGETIKLAGIVAAVCMAVIGFVQPDRQYRKYVIAWRLLDEKVIRYRYNLISIEELLDGMLAAERTLDQIERDAKQPTAISNPMPQSKTAGIP